MEMAYDSWIGIPTLVCSTLSALATGTVMMMWITARHDEKWSFRYMLILNLTIAGKCISHLRRKTIFH